jgi:homoserine dehydrogenase
MSLKKISLIQLGLGGVGRALVQQVIENRERHAKQLGVRLNYVAPADADGLVLKKSGLSDQELAACMVLKANKGRLREMRKGQAWNGDASLLAQIRSKNVIVVDVSASDRPIPVLQEARRRDWGIVLANKLPLAGSFKLFQELAHSRLTRFETTVAAALPVISTLQLYLLDTGDNVKSIRGCVSGTLNMVCQRLENGEKFSEIIRDAKAHGHTEPDPREDVGGRDAARKALILARLLGYPLEFKDVDAESLYPKEWDRLSIDDFMQKLPELDSRYAKLSHETQSENLRLRYVIEVANGLCKANLQRLTANDDLIRASLADSVLAFETERYNPPLIVRGRGSGPSLTASGVLSDILSLAQMM